MAAQEAIPGMKALAIRQPSMEEIMQLAVERGQVDALKTIVAVKFQIDDRRALEEFNECMSKCQSEMEPVRKDCQNPQTKSRYASYAALNKALRPIYTKYGFSISFSTADCPIPDHVRVLAYVGRGAFTRTYQTDVPCDGKGAKGGDVMTKTHAHGAAHMYGRRYLLKDIFDIVEAGDDIDGNEPTEDWVQDHLDNLRQMTDQESLRGAFKEAYKATANFPKAQKQIVNLYEARKKELR